MPSREKIEKIVKLVLKHKKGVLISASGIPFFRKTDSNVSPVFDDAKEVLTGTEYPLETKKIQKPIDYNESTAYWYAKKN